MRSPLILLTAVLCVSPLWGGTKRVPFSLETVTPQFTSSGWSQFLGVALHVNQRSPGSPDQFDIYQWFTTGKGNPYTGPQVLQPSNRHQIQVSYGTLTASSEPVESSMEPLINSKEMLHIAYDLTHPTRPSEGGSYVTISGNSPAPLMVTGESLRVGFWLRGTIDEASLEGLRMSGSAATFGGDIFTEQPMRLFLSYTAPSKVYNLQSYSIQTDTSKVVLGPHRFEEVKSDLATLRRVHSADSPRGLQSQQGFVVSPQWQYIEVNPFYVTSWDLRTGIISFEITLQLPYLVHPDPSHPSWANTSGYYDIAGIQWWIESTASPDTP